MPSQDTSKNGDMTTEEAAMYTYMGSDRPGARHITEAQFLELEKLLHKLCITSKGVQGKFRQQFMVFCQIIAIGVNHYAQEHGIHIQVRWGAQAQATYTTQALYVCRKEWLQHEREVWQKSTVFERREICSFEGPWNWSEVDILLVAILNQKLKARSGFTQLASKFYIQQDVLRMIWWVKNDTNFAYALTLEFNDETRALLLLPPGTFGKDDGEVREELGLPSKRSNKHIIASVPKSRHCPSAEVLALAFQAILDEGDASDEWEVAQLVKWKEVETNRVDKGEWP